MNVVIIEDEVLAADKIEGFVQQFEPQVNVVGQLDSIKSAQRWFEGNEMPDLAFCDIELLDGNVFKLFESVSVTCPIIFTTSYDKYLLEAFNVNGIAYLLKPFDYKSFEKAMQKYDTLKNNFNPLDKKFIEQLKQTVGNSEQSYKQRFAVKSTKGIYIIGVKDIAFIQVVSGIVYAFTKNGKKYPLNHSMNQLESLLNPNHFFRINRSEMINIDFIEKLESYFNDRLAIQVTNFSDKLIASTSRTPELRKWIDR